VENGALVPNYAFILGTMDKIVEWAMYYIRKQYSNFKGAQAGDILRRVFCTIQVCMGR
jgi:hypothetical protein